MSEEATKHPEAGGDTVRSRSRRLARVLTWVAAAIGALLLLAAVLWAFGGPMPPSAATRDAFDAMVASGQAAPVASGLVVPIPGCVCHSDDQVLQVQHSTRRLRDCSGCHGR